MAGTSAISQFVPHSSHFPKRVISEIKSSKRQSAGRLETGSLGEDRRECFHKNTQVASPTTKFSKSRIVHARRKIRSRVARSDVTTDDEKSPNGSTIQSPGSGINIAVVEEAHRGTADGEQVLLIGSSTAEQGLDCPKRISFDYGFQAKFLRKGPTVPRNVIKLALENFGREWRALRRSYLFGELEKIDINNVEGGPLGIASVYLGRGFVLFLRAFDRLLQLYDGLPELKPEISSVGEDVDELQRTLKKLTLSNEAVWEREKSRPPVKAPWWILGPYYVLCLMLDVIFKDRPIQRFWFLETVARMPYFSYISMLHLYETLGWWRVGAEVRKVHFAEEWNEMHHLKIMESLGGDLEWRDRFFGQHAAFFYYWILNLMFLISPKVAYNFSELIEMHAVDTYGQFVDENEKLLRKLPPPPVAVEYYESEDLYMYDDFQTSQLPETRRPKINSLYDVFSAIAGDEYEHVKTMIACQQLDNVVVSPHKAQIKSSKN